MTKLITKQYSFYALLVGVVFLLGMPAAEAGPAKVDRITVGTKDWPWWRGPAGNGIAAAEQNPPLSWSDSENIVWSAPLPGRGHGSATVVGDQVVLATADEVREIQSVLCLSRHTGELLWKRAIHVGGLEKKSNEKASQASCTLACDGKRFFVNFLNKGVVYTTAVSREGEKLWQTKVSEYVTHQGFSSSPALYGPLVIVSADTKRGGAICGLNRASGEEVWRVERPKLPNYVSPSILRVAGRTQLLFSGCDLVTSLDPLTGTKLWETKGATTECVTTMVTDGQRVFTSGGYPRNHVSAIVADGSREVAWNQSVRVYVPSMLVRDRYLYVVADAGIAVCFNSEDGSSLWRGRLGGTFSSSPVMVGDHILATNERGATFVYKANPAAFELVGQNQLGEEVFATPTVCGGRIYLRSASREGGRRRETLYCIGRK